MNAVKNILKYTSLFMLCITVACHKKVVPTKVVVDYTSQGYVKATMIDKTGLDGCGFLIKLDNGEEIEPNKLHDDFRKEGMKIWVKYNNPKTPLISICMSGKMVNIVDMKLQE